MSGVCGACQEDSFLSLPLSLFNCFDPLSEGHVNLYHVFVMLALFCNGAWRCARWSAGY
jgi:hypothetical protein